MTDLLFVYGTLLQADNHFAVYLRARCSLFSKGYTPGRLYDLGEYPGMIEEEHGGQLVHGSVFRMQDPKAVLKELDAYEGVGADEEQPNLYRREIVKVVTDGGTVEAWCYIYNRDVGGYSLVENGDYINYMNKKSRG